jgi:hypothetical protein
MSESVRQYRSERRPSRSQILLEQAWLVLFLLALGWAVSTKGTDRSLGGAAAPAVAVLVTTAGAVLCCMRRDLPSQVVLFLFAGAVMLSSAAQFMYFVLSATFYSRPFTFDESILADPFVFGTVLVTSRSAAQSLLLPWRSVSTYGYWLLAASVLLATLLTSIPSGAPTLWTASASSPLLDQPWLTLVASGLIYLALTPWFVKTRPSFCIPSFKPLIVWTALLVMPFLSR